jgi:murein DD-endopeptidase MepM/ murein hydrolase activator NlpD
MDKNKPAAIVFIVAATALVTALAYNPASVALFKLTEPYFKYPVKGQIVIRNDSFGEGDFGAKRRGGRSHAGIDILAEEGSDVYAAKSGVAFCGNVPTGYGKYVMILHPDGLQTMYGHLSEQTVYSGKRVRRGELIGRVGKTGNADNKFMQPHLHFEIRSRDGAVDPRGLVR